MIAGSVLVAANGASTPRWRQPAALTGVRSPRTVSGDSECRDRYPAPWTRLERFTPNGLAGDVADVAWPMPVLVCVTRSTSAMMRAELVRTRSSVMRCRSVPAGGWGDYQAVSAARIRCPYYGGESVYHWTVVVGNAAQTLHPIAGQVFISVCAMS